MRRLMLVSVIAMLSGVWADQAHSMGAGDYMGLSPEQVQGIFDNQRAYDEMNLRAILELRRQQEEEARYRSQNPFAGCLSLGEVKGKSVEEAISLGKKIGGTNIQYVETTSDYVRANIYKCPQK